MQPVDSIFVFVAFPMHSTNQRNSYVILWVSLVSVFFIGFILDRHLESKTSAKVVVKHPLEASNQEKHLLARKRVVFFGDSITEGYPFDRNISSWTSVLINWWTRRADTFNRGFSGYNSDLALMILQDTVLSVKPDLVLIFFGANDAAVPSGICLVTRYNVEIISTFYFFLHMNYQIYMTSTVRMFLCRDIEKI